LALSCALSITACGDDEDDGGKSGSGGSAGNAGEGGDAGDAGEGGAGAGGTSGGAGGTSGGAGGTTGGAGGTTGGAGGTAGNDEDGGIDDDDGGSEKPITASAEIEGVDDNELNGTVTFTAEDADVSVYIELNDCADGSYQVHIHEGASCDNYGPHWDVPRGEGIPNITCDNDHGEGAYTRLGTDPEPWSVDLDEEDTDVNGHTFVVHDSGGTVLACGEISVD
jgi:hypothetical protein